MTGKYLGIHYQTVKNAWTKVYAKLDISGQHSKRIKAITKALRFGIIKVSDLVSERDALER